MNALALPHMGKKIAVRLAELNLSQSDLAELIGYTRQAVSRLIKSPTIRSVTVHRIAKSLKVPVNYFFEQ